jgi:hypothetical protein
MGPNGGSVATDSVDMDPVRSETSGRIRKISLRIRTAKNFSDKLTKFTIFQQNAQLKKIYAKKSS